MIRAGPLHQPAPATLPWTNGPPGPPPPKALYQRPLGKANKIQTAHDQQKVLAWNPNFPPIKTMASNRRPVLERETPTQITPGRAKTCLRARRTARNLRNTSKNLRIFTRRSGHSWRGFTQPWSSSPRTDILNLRILPTRRPTCPPPPNKMALSHRSWPSNPRCTHPQYTPHKPQNCLRHVPALTRALTLA